ncbi:MAG: thermonuclease family protein [Candidatus Polarisedimenticolia bacterium]
MTRRPLLFLPILVLAITSGLAAEIAKVVAVVDGDTIKVELPSGVETVRLIGVDTPETIHPQKPVEHFGKEASAFTTRVSFGQVVRLEDDPQGANRDKYARLLRYVFLPDGKLLNAVCGGPGREYSVSHRAARGLHAAEFPRIPCLYRGDLHHDKRPIWKPHARPVRQDGRAALVPIVRGRI